MGNKVFDAILTEKIDLFKFVFGQSSKKIFWDEKTGKLIHPGEFGSYRESVCREFLKMTLPSRIEIAEGFLMTSNNKVSTQCDIVIYDKTNTPLIENNLLQKFFPIETVISVGEIKSDLSKKQLKVALNKLARNKLLRQEVDTTNIIKRRSKTDLSLTGNPRDNVFSFIICNSFKFDIQKTLNEIDGFYDSDIKAWHKHNLILSITDGLVLYQAQDGKLRYQPNLNNGTMFKPKLIRYRAEKPNHHLVHFVNCIYNATSSTTLYHPQMAKYLNHDK